jgi:hypothetical protein
MTKSAYQGLLVCAIPLDNLHDIGISPERIPANLDWLWKSTIFHTSPPFPRRSNIGTGIRAGSGANMARALNKLTAEATEAISKPGRHSDGGNLYLAISADGRRRWTFLYTWNGSLREAGLGAARAACRWRRRAKRPLRAERWLGPASIL